MQAQQQAQEQAQEQAQAQVVPARAPFDREPFNKLSHIVATDLRCLINNMEPYGTITVHTREEQRLKACG